MEPDPDDRAVRIAARIADGSAIDWPAAESADATPADRALFSELRTIADVATVHRAPAVEVGASPIPAAWGPLTILSSVGRGRFGEVFVAWDARLHRRVALKLLHTASSSQAPPTRAIDEARLLARVRHPNVLTVHGAECLGDQVGIWTEFIEGRTLEQLVKERGRLDADEVMAIGADLARALEAVHAAGLLHRDIKAQNVMRETGGRIVLMDFGAGHDLELAPTRSGDYTGTPLYLAPEVLAGDAASRASDIYALGVLLFHLLTGTHPVTGQTLEEVRAAHQDGRVNRLQDVRPDTPEQLRKNIETCLATNPAERFSTANGLADALAPAREQPLASEQWSRTQKLSVATGAVALVAIVWLGVTQFRSGPSDADIVIGRMWNGPDVRADGTASADGQFLSATAGEGDVLVRDLLSGTNTLLVKSETNGQNYRHAIMDGNALSRDGRRVAYGWCDNCEGAVPKHPVQLRVVSVGKENDPVTLLERAEIPWIVPYDWSPDGARIAVAFGLQDRTTHVGLVWAATGDLQDLKTVDWRGPSRMVFSPDGRYLAYDLAEENTVSRDVFVLDTRNSESVTAVAHPKNDVLAGWSPDGSTLLFTSDRSGAIGVWGVQMAGGKPMGMPWPIRPDLGSRSFAITVTSSGTLIYGSQLSSQNVYVAEMDFASGRLVSPLSEAIEYYGFRNANPDWHPDGSLVMVADRPRNLKTLWILPVGNGEPIRELLPQLDDFQRPRWAPDGSITVQGTDRSGKRGFFRVDARSGETSTILACGALCQQASWTPNGQRLVFRRQAATGVSVVIRNIATGEEQILAAKPGGTGGIDGVSVAPDGTQLTYVARDGATGTSVLNLMPTAGGPVRELARARRPNALGNVAGWTPDSTRLIVARSTGPDVDTIRYWLVPIDGGPEIELRDIHPRHGTNAIRVHPDGRHVAFSMGESSYEVWSVSNFLTAAGGPGSQAGGSR